ncbi:glycosyltransferase [Clostridium sp. YIM B02515]|uniref:Glycosyltransferase n=1 Tax=Clostridium rhizosphaerae TaxID=2803861 RepID=A0ABS1TAF8_9CLOT|nr:glycosyltransferase [Clostridium rhizosphaerae]MBL4936339.1 glycosyltransferase [Clostridium rhizosphaerae]
MKNIMYFLWRGGMGGGEKVVINLAKNINREQFKIYVCLWWKEEDSKRFKEILTLNNIEILQLDGENKFTLKVFKQLCNLLEEHKINIIHSHGVVAKFFGTLAGRIKKVTPVITIHRLTKDRSFKHKILNLFSIILSKKIIFVSNEVKRTLNIFEKLCIRKKSNKVIYNGVNFREITLLSNIKDDLAIQLEREKKENQFKYITFIGRLDPIKGLDYLLEAFKRLIKIDDLFRLIIVGDGEYRESIINKINELKLASKIKMCGHKDNVYPYLKLSEVFVSPSLSEGLPLSILEASILDVPIVATNVGGVGEILDNYKNKIYINPKNVDEIINGVEKIIKLKKIDNINNLQKFELCNMIEKHEKIYVGK